jgi:glycosyltransferase involved in cell wall biosynthesis
MTTVERFDAITIDLREEATAGDPAADHIRPVDISVVMPCLNEEDSIATCIEWALEGIRKTGLVGEVVVADNGSTDRSVEIATAAGARVVHQPEKGYGNAYLKGFSEARGRYIVMGDSDATYDFSKLDELIARLDEGYDYVLGSRFAGTIQKGAMPWLHRYIGNPVLTGILNLFFGLKSSDAHSGMRAFTREAFERMELQCEGMEFASEIVIKAARSKLKVAEVPIVYHPRQGESKLKSLRDGWRHLRFMLLLCPKWLFMIPGAVLLAVGMVGQSILLAGNFEVSGRSLGMHFSAVFALIAIIGAQAVFFGVFCRAYAAHLGLEPPSKTSTWVLDHFRLERGLIASALFFVTGFVFDIWVLFDWLNNEMGETNLMKQALFALTLMVLGSGGVFASFFLSFLSMKLHAPGEKRARSGSAAS